MCGGSSNTSAYFSMGTIMSKLLSYVHVETLMSAYGFHVEGGLTVLSLTDARRCQLRNQGGF